MRSSRPFRVLAGLAVALALTGGAARAETLVNADLAFTAALPCQSQSSTTPVVTAMGTLSMYGFSCSTSEGFFAVFVGDYPKGSITNLAASYTGAVNGATNNVKGTLRQVKDYPVGALVGRDVWIDFTQSGQAGAVHARYLIVGDRIYQALYVGALGSEDGKTALDFLNSFKPG